MLQQKQGTRVRIASHENVINMSDIYIPNDSTCSCFDCESTGCFNVRNLNSGIPCSCTDCDPNRCLTWEIKTYEPKPKNETRNINLTPEISKDLINVPDTIRKCNHSNNKKCSEHPTNEIKKERISISFLEDDLQNNTSDPELKEVFTKLEKRVGKCGAMKKLSENHNIDDFEVKDASSNENSDIIECGASRLEKKHSNDPEIKQVSAKDGSDTKISCSRNRTFELKNGREHEKRPSLTSKEIKDKQLPSKNKMSFHLNDSKELLMKKIRNSFSEKISTDNIKSDSPKVLQIFKNEKKNIVKRCNNCNNTEEQHTDASEKKQDHPENKIPHSKVKSKDVQFKKTDTTDSNLEINTTKKIRNVKCNHEHPIKDKFSDIDLENYTTYSYKDVSHTRNKINVNKNNKSYEKYVSHLQSVAISYARPDYENSRAELSAQIMNVPYDEFKDSLSTKQSPTDSNTCNSSTKIGTFDIFARLKEIYKACSCKVCECIGGKSIFNQTDICKCGPCDCDDCNGLMAKLQKRIDNAPHSGCPCIRCDRKDCRGVVRSTSDYAACDCKPCDCLRRSESFSKPCSCAPCQCETCKTSIFMPQSLMVANAAESFRQSNCDCDPCECTNCTSRYSAMTSNLMREVSTGMITYGNCNCEECTNNACQLGRSDCRCESQQHKVIRKPIVEKKPDYGIHRVHIKEDKYEKKPRTKNNHNTIAMFALSNNYPKIFFNYSNKIKTCECDVCECIVCKDKGKGSIVNKTHEIDKTNCDFNISPRNNCECSPCECQRCTSLHADNIDGKSYMETGYDACNCRSSKHLGYNCNNNNNNGLNYNFKKVKPTYSMVENNCTRKLHEYIECKNLVNKHSLISMDIDLDKDESYFHDNDKFYHLKKGTLLTPSMFENKALKSNSSHIHIKPKIESLNENDLGKKIFTNEQNTKLSRSKSRHNYFDTEYKDITNDTLESVVKVKSTNSSLINMVSKEIGTNEIYKINSIDFKRDNNSKVFFEHSKSTVQNEHSNTILLDRGLAHMPTELSSHCNKKLEHDKDLNESSQTSLERQEFEDSFYKTISSSKNDVHFSSAKSMSLVKLMCKERNLNVDNKNTRNFLQSLEKIPLKMLKMDDENVSFNWDKTFNNDNYFLQSLEKIPLKMLRMDEENVSFNWDKTFNNDNYSYLFNNNLFVNMDQDKLSAFNCENKKLEKDLIDKKKENNDVHDKNAVEEPFPKTTKLITSKEKDNFQIVERKPNNYNIRANQSLVQPKSNKPCSEAKVAKSNVKGKTENQSKGNVNKVNNKRSLEIPDVTNTATSAVNFTESDKCIDFEKSFKLLKEVNFSYGEKKKASPILRKNFFFNPEVGKNEGKGSKTFELDVKNAVKSTSLQTNTMFPYSPVIGFGNIALTKLQTEVNELLYSSLLQSSPTNSQTEKLRSKSKVIPELNEYMSDATSQTKRTNIIVDKEINCNMIESRENLRQSIQNLINMTLSKVVQPTDVETGKQHFIRDFNKESCLHPASSSYGRLKASFVGLRKVSDHSVLLKWAMPSDRSKIQGYEVDGRPVKKILNPSRCMAVLTCLPHCEKLLLTIRTITNVETCHIPVTTIVYKPKINKSES